MNIKQNNREEYLGIQINRENPSYVSPAGEKLLEKYYSNGDSISKAFARPAVAFCAGDLELAQRIYDYIDNGWFMYASPVLSNAPEGKWVDNKFEVIKKGAGLPISCFAFDVGDSIKDQTEVMSEAALLSVSGGGTGAHMSIRAVSNKAPGPIPYMKVLDSVIGYYRQGVVRRGAVAAYMDVSHPDIVEHIRFRVPGGDMARRSDNRKQFHSGVNLTDKFINQVLDGGDFNLDCPHTGKTYETVKARALWEEILETRALTGEPFLTKIDLINRYLPETQKAKGLRVRGSNLCSEIVLATDSLRTFVCCLSSLNLEKFDEWCNTTIVEDLIVFLDNTLQYFIDNAPAGLSKAVYSATMERALGLGTFGWHAYLQSKMIPFESGGFNSAIQHTHKIFKLIKERAVASSRKLAAERGEPEDMKGTGLRNSHLLAIAPNANSADLADTSPSIEPVYRNVFVKDTRAGAFKIKNRYLEQVLEKYEMNTDDVWDSIDKNSGSVQHLEFLTEHEKNVFKTAMELDQHWIIEQANARGQYICQAQSLNVFFLPGSDRSYVNSVHLKFLRSEYVKTMYYYRTERESKVDTANTKIQRQSMADWKGDECVACQG